MREMMRDLMTVMLGCIALDEVMASELAGDAAALQASGQIEVAGTLRCLARIHRVKALELQGQLAALIVDYNRLFQGEPETTP
jgi:hypothetical protein